MRRPTGTRSAPAADGPDPARSAAERKRASTLPATAGRAVFPGPANRAFSGAQESRQTGPQNSTEAKAPTSSNPTRLYTARADAL
jgi:hypothetical protein